MIANPDNRHKKRERKKTGSGHPQPHCAMPRSIKFGHGKHGILFKAVHFTNFIDH